MSMNIINVQCHWSIVDYDIENASLNRENRVQRAIKWQRGHFIESKKNKSFFGRYAHPGEECFPT